MADIKKPVLDLKGSEQHHDLKNQPGENGDPNHTENDTRGGDAEKTVEVAIANADTNTQMASALKKAVK